MSKLAGEGYCRLYGRLYGLETVVLRLGNVYGPRQDPHGEAGVVSIFSARILDGDRPRVFGDGTQTRDYVFVGDVVNAFRAARTDGTGQTINIGWGREVSVLDLLDGLACPFEPEFAPARAGELLRSALANDRARELLGWAPGTALEDGLRITRRCDRGDPPRSGCTPAGCHRHRHGVARRVSARIGPHTFPAHSRERVAPRDPARPTSTLRRRRRSVSSPG